LGDAPLGRILFDPMPDSVTEADVLRWADGEPRKLVELIDGTLVERAVGFEGSEIAIHIGYLLKGFLRPRGLGRIAGADGTIRLRSRRVRIPDVGFYAYASLPGGTMPAGPIPDLAPDLAVEVLSEGNTPRAMRLKRTDYFGSGTRLVWEVDPSTRTVQVYTDPATFIRLGGDRHDHWRPGRSVAGPARRRVVRRRLNRSPPVQDRPQVVL
jgi:Uma2 family endonuclease